MFLVLLKFSENLSQASQHMAAHNDWLKRGFDDGIFLLSGSIQPRLGGALFAHSISLAELQSRVNDDPFVTNKVVDAEIIEITPGCTDERLDFLINT